MCGIVGYIGSREPKNILLDGLKNLEYRGYDSAGIALKNNNQVQVIRGLGRISCLEEKINNMVYNIMEDDNLWQEIDYTIEDVIEKEI